MSICLTESCGSESLLTCTSGITSTLVDLADDGTRPVAAAALINTNWFSGPSYLSKPQQDQTTQTDNFELVHPDTDQEIRPEVTTFSTKVTESLLGSHRFSEVLHLEVIDTSRVQPN